MILVVGGIKGGSGKTTLATNLAVIRSASGKKLLLVDADEQKSVSDWVDLREDQTVNTSWTTIKLDGKKLYAQLERMSQDYDDIIIDVGGRDLTSQRSALAIADVLLVPFKPRSLDIWTLGHVKKMINEMSVFNPKLKSVAVINQADSKGSDNKDAIDVISSCSELICLHMYVGLRKAFANASSEGLGVIEMEKKDKKAIQEIEELYKYLYTELI